MSPALPLVLLWVGGAVACFLDGRRRATAAAALIVVAAAMTAAGVLLRASIVGGPRELLVGGWPLGIGIRLRADAAGTFFLVVSLVAVAGALLFETIHGVLTRTLPAVLLLLAAGLAGLFLTADLFNFYVFFELTMIASFALAAYGEEPMEVRAGVLFAAVNLVGSAIFLSAIAALYRLAGTLDMTELATRMAEDGAPHMLVATLFFVGFGLKLGLFPFHFWLPPVYRGARPIVAAVLSGAVAGIGSYGLLRLGLELFPLQLAAARPVLLGIGAASVLYGGVLATSRRVPGEVLAYSSIGQAGFVLVALAVGGPVGILAAVLYAAVNALNKTLLFLSGASAGALTGVAFVVGAFSVAGIPPTPGFAGKLELFRMGVVGPDVWILALVLAGSALSFVYMFQSYQHTYWAGYEHGVAAPPAARVLLVVLSGLLLALGLWPEPLLVSSGAAAAALVGSQ